MNYEEAVDYLYARLPMFTRDGVSAFKKDLTNTWQLCEALNNPQERFRSLHIAGTNGKGSTSHMLAAILQAAGYRTGLYTSPHLLDFRERIRIDGALVSKQSVTDFINQHRPLIESIQPSFFEVTVAMAFDYFAREKVDIAVIETGLGGRLDSTNVINPLLSIITNIGYDHTNMLGNTLQEIAGEKAGIIKSGVPVVVGEWQPEVSGTFERIASEKKSPLVYASLEWRVRPTQNGQAYQYLEAIHRGEPNGSCYALDLKGRYQAKNLPAVLMAVEILRSKGFSIEEVQVKQALKQVQRVTGLMGRWQTLASAPLIICDTGHNVDGWHEVLANIAVTPHSRLHMVLGVMRDKDLDKMLPLLPEDARYYFCEVAMPRALPAAELLAAAAMHGLDGEARSSVADALQAAQQHAAEDDLIFIGGSTFIVADALLALGFKS
ncbi:bifunctional folylpolyglutamate synthase/dihydrofolate synthase [Parapedobacter indicus]|uniref:Dihydrofolate synthase/folylpolyglutamate synthase n=1 Tax=Parapedobacter indicus TaxID=1477437 RepID=A0A1I3D8N6_9SPHI|nr:folylpolyglutamate synthase/dihydrofolate synthase family protein [Parapedobacter indicus]PPL04567.1 dihydrofolate synthase/folylpolyglutamate synthase [Parapedobacter indicus]SFH82938.1 dihydrofolate synthase / folylpolyglutamate synthase [Parapedobacter indicus]